MVQGLLCEVRKFFDDEGEERRPGWEERMDAYRADLKLFLHDWGLSACGAKPRRKTVPSKSLPSSSSAQDKPVHAEPRW
jgi:hypothetical protein